MAKTTKKPTKAKKTTPFWKNPEYNRRVGYALVVVIVLVAGGLFAKNQFEEYDSAQRFKQAESVVEDTYAQIVSRIGEPDQVERVRNCDRANLKNARGPLLCNVDIDLFYENRPSGESNRLLELISQTSTSKIKSGFGGSPDTLRFKDIAEKNVEQIYFQHLKEVYGLSCGFSYRYPATFKFEKVSFLVTHAENFLVSFGCGGRAKAEHYPLRD
jgi:hypothetical protein